MSGKAFGQDRRGAQAFGGAIGLAPGERSGGRHTAMKLIRIKENRAGNVVAGKRAQHARQKAGGEEMHMEAATATSGETSARRMTKPPGAYRHGDLRNALIAAATELTVQRGGPDFTLREIAAITGVRHAAVYRHFASKAALLEEIARLGVQALRARIEQEQAGSPGDRLEAIAGDYLEFAVSRPGEYRVMAQEGGASSSQYRALLEMMAGPVAAAQSAGALRKDVPSDMLARLWWAELHGLSMLALNSAMKASELGECVRAVSRIWRADAPALQPA